MKWYASGRRNKIRGVFACALGSALWFAFGFAKANQPIDIYTKHLPPYQVVLDGKLIGGLSVEKVEGILERAGIDSETQVLPWARSYHQSLIKPNVLIYSLARTPIREHQFHWIEHLSTHQTQLMGLKNRAYSFASLESIKNFNVAVKRGDVAHQYLLSKGFTEESNLTALRDTEDTLRLLMNKRVDFVILDPTMVTNYCVNLGCNEEDFEFYFHIEDLNQELYLAASLKTDTNILQRLREAARLLQ